MTNEDIHKMIMRRINYSYGVTEGPEMEGITRGNLSTYISMGILCDVDTYTLECVICENSSLSDTEVLDAIEQYMTDEGIHSGKKSGKGVKPIKYKGKVYPSRRVLLDELQMSVQEYRRLRRAGKIKGAGTCRKI